MSYLELNKSYIIYDDNEYKKYIDSQGISNEEIETPTHYPCIFVWYVNRQSNEIYGEFVYENDFDYTIDFINHKI